MSSHPGVSLETTLHVRDHCLCLHTQRAARALARMFDDAFRPLALTSGQFSLMMSLNRPDPPPIGRLADFLAVDRTTLTAALKPLERRGLVQVRQHPHDRRSRLVALTSAGKALLAQAVPIWMDSHAKVESSLSQGESNRLRSSLNELAKMIAPQEVSE